ncbi:hypothetical protein V565_206670, partial [Rhizoctonia solani 123E]
MTKAAATRAKATASRTASSSKEPTLPTSRAGSVAAEPLPTPEDSALFVKPLTATAAKAFLFGQNYLESKTETVTASLCSNLLAAIADHPDATEAICALISSVRLILPIAFELVCETNARLTSIADKVDSLLASPDKEPHAPSPPVLVELGEKLDKVTKDIQKATETWQTVPPRTRDRTPPPCPQPAPTPPAPVGPTRAELSRNRRLLSQGCFILVEPTPSGSLDNLTARALVQKAEFAWNAAWEKIKDTDTSRSLKLTEKPRVAFKAANRLARGGVRYELGDRTQAALLSDARISVEFEKGFGGASCRGQGATILLQCAPVEYNPEDPAAIPRFEEENMLQRGDVLSMSWCKPAHKRKPEQTMAVLKLEMRSHDLADRLITEGGQLQYTPVLFRKASQEPMRCLRCQKYGHKVIKCLNGPEDVCSQCGGAHRIANCDDKDKKWCVPCQSGAHCSYDRDCPSFKAEREKFNARRPENKSLLFGGPRAYDPRHRPLNLPPHPISEMFPDGGYTSHAVAQNQAYIDAYRPPRWHSRERLRKETGQGELWEGPNLWTAPLSLARVTGSNAMRVDAPWYHILPNPATATARSPSPPASAFAHIFTPAAYSPSRPTPVTPTRERVTLEVPPTPSHESILSSPLQFP